MIDQIQRRQLEAAKRGLGRTSKPQSVPAPLKGWNTRDPYEAMEPEDAILLDNWYADFAGVLMRSGSSTYLTGLSSSPTRTLASLKTATVQKAMAASGGRIYDVSSPNNPPILADGFASDAWQTVQFNNRSIWANGSLSDPVLIYDGTNMVPANFTGVPTNTLTGVGVFNNRLYFWTGVDAGFWYGPVNGIAGALSFFDLSTVTLAGGALIAVEVLSYDGGTGINDYTCFFMSSGEILMYSGTDPSNANNWSLTGRYVLPRIVGPRAIVRYGGDVYLATETDHQQLSQLLIALRLGEVPPRTKISGAAAAAYKAGSTLFGWQALYYPGGPWLIFNIPNVDGTFSQHIYNTSTKAWSRFKGWNAYCLGVYNGLLYFGGANGSIVHANIGTSDNGTAITATAQQAWQRFGTPLKKRVAAIRVNVQSSEVATWSTVLGFEYQADSVTIPDTTLGVGMIWGSSKWGSPTVWGTSGITDPRWHVATGEGSAISWGLIATAKAGATWVSTDLLIEPGANL